MTATTSRAEFYPVRISGDSALDMIPLATAKLHLRVDHTSEDSLIEAMIETAVVAIEQMTNRILRPGNFYLYADEWRSQAFTFGPVNSISAVEYYDEANELSELSSGWWADLNSTPQRITFLAPPTIYSDRHQGIRITANCGEATIPAPLRQAALLLVGHYYENRQAVVAGQQPNEVPLAVYHLSNPYRLWA